MSQVCRLRSIASYQGSVALTMGDTIGSAFALIEGYYILWLDRIMQQSHTDQILSELAEDAINPAAT